MVVVGRLLFELRRQIRKMKGKQARLLALSWPVVGPGLLRITSPLWLGACQKPLVLHVLSVARSPSHRRVIHIVFFDNLARWAAVGHQLRSRCVRVRQPADADAAPNSGFRSVEHFDQMNDYKLRWFENETIPNKRC